MNPAARQTKSLWKGSSDFERLESCLLKWMREERSFLKEDAGSRVSGEKRFASLALEIYDFQRRWNSQYDRYCAAKNVRTDLSDWREIPAVPQQIFKDVPLRCFPEDWTVQTFRTSGTTGQSFGQHHFCSLSLYEASLASGWRYFDLPTAMPEVIVTLSPEDAPHSSLSHMMGVLTQFAPKGQVEVVLTADGKLLVDSVLRAAEKSRSTQTPVLLLGTALGFLNLFEVLEQRSIQCAFFAGSCAMETGGYKGSGRELTKEVLYAQFEKCLGLPPEAIINEYGMTELSSPFYTRGLGQAHFGTPWARAVVMGLETGEEVELGEMGVVRLYDLANLGSVIGIQTQDLAIRRENGGFDLLGRDPSGLPRGCSRAVDEQLQGSR